MTNKSCEVKVEKYYGRLRIRIDGIIHLSFPYQEEDAKFAVHAYFLGKDNFHNIDYHFPNMVIETGYTRKDLFAAILSELEKQNVI